MKRIGLVAGGGSLPVEFLDSAKKAGDEVIVLAINGVASPILSERADRIYWIEFGAYGKAIFYLLKHRINNIAVLGKISRDLIHKKDTLDEETKKVISKIDNKRDYSIYSAITANLKKIGIDMMDPSEYLRHLIPSAGILGSVRPDEKTEEDLLFGYETAKKLSGMDIGQAVVIKDKTVVAVEAMEGTDAVIKRCREIASGGCVLVKVARPDQDMRWDIPTVGLETAKNLVDAKFKAIAVESGKMFILDRDMFVKTADEAGMAVKAF
ncbi:MAG: UDP-2,3-diacylglucosamine diphosphatase LpxI [Candidatus Omnitrophica bacterium]|nr:UDP-2,3-diacylglucosamine diphosphatase LpxI [Candidatus Omnitrophota bacterium]